jgi:hypothetical protein
MAFHHNPGALQGNISPGARIWGAFSPGSGVTQFSSDDRHPGGASPPALALGGNTSAHWHSPSRSSCTDPLPNRRSNSSLAGSGLPPLRGLIFPDLADIGRT